MNEICSKKNKGKGAKETKNVCKQKKITKGRKNVRNENCSELNRKYCFQNDQAEP